MRASDSPQAAQWKYRRHIKGDSGSHYVIARNEKSGEWGCSCPGYRFHRHCKHLDRRGLEIHGDKR